MFTYKCIACGNKYHTQILTGRHDTFCPSCKGKIVPAIKEIFKQRKDTNHDLNS